MHGNTLLEFKFSNFLWWIRILSNEADENGVFLIWGNSQECTNDVSRDILSFTYNYDVFHVYLDIQTIPNSANYSDAVSLSHLEIGNNEWMIC